MRLACESRKRSHRKTTTVFGDESSLVRERDLQQRPVELLRNSTQLNDSYVVALEREMGLDLPRLRACVLGDRYENAIVRSAAEPASLGIYGTPTFVIGRTAEGKLDGIRVVGAPSYEKFAAYLDRLLTGR